MVKTLIVLVLNWQISHSNSSAFSCVPLWIPTILSWSISEKFQMDNFHILILGDSLLFCCELLNDCWGQTQIWSDKDILDEEKNLVYFFTAVLYGREFLEEEDRIYTRKNRFLNYLWMFYGKILIGTFHTLPVLYLCDFPSGCSVQGLLWSCKGILDNRKKQAFLWASNIDGENFTEHVLHCI